MDAHLREIILNATGARDCHSPETIQSLWSGYGSLDRYRLSGADRTSVIVKHVRFPTRQQHPRGWNTDISDQRKRRSYEVESAWYADFAPRCGSQCRVPQCLTLETHQIDVLIIMEDLDASGFPARPSRLSQAQMVICLQWLAQFHARFLGTEPAGLWPVGTYWHLDTRPDELARMEDGELKNAAAAIDAKLRRAHFQTLVHGDAKLANFCFSADGEQVAAVDFQYVGGGCGMKDVAYFISSCLNERECERLESPLLDAYFDALGAALREHQPTIEPGEVEAEWRPLYPVAWTDFYRFLKGWSPGHWKIHSYSERLAREVIDGELFV